MSDKPYHKGYYTGAFDIFHKGHVNSIKLAASLCDELFVGVSTDEVIEGYKCHKPIIPFEERINVINSIKGVKMALPQYDLYNKVEMCKTIGADVLFSSEEYLRSSYENQEEMTLKQVAGVERWETFSSEAREEGIDVVFLPRTNCVSSSKIKDEIIERYFSSEIQPQVESYAAHDCVQEFDEQCL